MTVYILWVVFVQLIPTISPRISRVTIQVVPHLLRQVNLRESSHIVVSLESFIAALITKNERSRPNHSVKIKWERRADRLDRWGWGEVYLFQDYVTTSNRYRTEGKG